MRIKWLALAAVFAIFAEGPANAESLRIGAWNIADLHHKEGEPLRSGSQSRDAEDFERLKTFADSLDLDIIALQEIGSPKALERIFPSADYHLVMSPRYTPGDEDKPSTERDIFTAFAVRKEAFPEAPDVEPLDALAINHVGFDRSGSPSSRPVRAGLVLTLDHGDEEIKVLGVHLKSGCNNRSLDPVFDTTRAGTTTRVRYTCRTAAAQAMILENWIEQQAELGNPVIVLGDFNRQFNRFDDVPGKNDHYWQMINDGGPEGLVLRKGPLGKNTTCWRPGDTFHFDEHIDFIVFDGSLDNNIQIDSIKKVGFPFQDDPKYQGSAGKKLSDHCPVVATLDLEPALSVNARTLVADPKKDEFTPSRAVQYQINSAEHRALAEATFRDARKRVEGIAKQRRSNPTPWVVSVDADETVLDNSTFEIEGQQQGVGYSEPRWHEWVERREAPSIPGALGFISHVLGLGGKVAVITNRLCDEAPATLDNLRSLGLEANPENICILVKEPSENRCKDRLKGDEADRKSAAQFGNKKEARRLAVRHGTAERCWQNKGDSVKASWAQPHDIVMYLGDNVEDFPGITQEAAAVNQELVSERLGLDWFLFPNAMYGSWH